MLKTQFQWFKYIKLEMERIFVVEIEAQIYETCTTQFRILFCHILYIISV